MIINNTKKNVLDYDDEVGGIIDNDEFDIAETLDTVSVIYYVSHLQIKGYLLLKLEENLISIYYMMENMSC